MNGRRSTPRRNGPYAISLQDGPLFAFAGLWERWKDKETGESTDTYTVITTDPNELMQSLHSRLQSSLLARRGTVLASVACMVGVSLPAAGFAETTHYALWSWSASPRFHLGE